MSQQFIWADMDKFPDLDGLLAHWKENKADFLNFIKSSVGYRHQQSSGLDTPNGLFPSPLLRSVLSKSSLLSLTRPEILQPSQIPAQLSITMRKLPFFETIIELVSPTLLTSVVNDAFTGRTELPLVIELSRLKDALYLHGMLTVDKAQEAKTNHPHILLRFCLINSDSSSVETEHSDCFPAGLQVKVNNWMVPITNFGGVMVIDITRWVSISPCLPLLYNIIHVTWEKEIGREYAMSLHMARKLQTREILQTILDKPCSTSYTLSLIKEINSTTREGETCISAELIKVSLDCPLVKRRMEYPCRSIAEGGCKHLQCFDAYQFLLMNDINLINPRFKCPVCNNKLRFDDLRIDEYFLEVLKQLPQDSGNKVELYPDGHWKPVYFESNRSVSYPKRRKIEYVSLDCSKNDEVKDTISDNDKNDLIPILEEEVQPRQSSMEGEIEIFPEINVGSENQCFLTLSSSGKFTDKRRCQGKVIQAQGTGPEKDTELITLD